MEDPPKVLQLREDRTLWEDIADVLECNEFRGRWEEAEDYDAEENAYEDEWYDRGYGDDSSGYDWSDGYGGYDADQDWEGTPENSSNYPAPRAGGDSLAMGQEIATPRTMRRSAGSNHYRKVRLQT